MLGFIPAKSDTVVVLLCRWVTRSKVADFQAAMCSFDQRQGYQLGYLAVVSNHTRSSIPFMARQSPNRSGTAPSSPNLDGADGQAGGSLEGQPQRKLGGCRGADRRGGDAANTAQVSHLQQT
jgi:hypothetical protein